MPKSAAIPWMISPRQKEGMELCRQKQFVLFSGPRLTGKTEGALNCVVDHAWRTDRGNISVVSVSQSTGLDSGIWNKLVRVTIPQWIESGGGMQWVKKPYIANVTKRPACSVTNSVGNVTEIQLDSLRYEQEVEERFKSREFSCMYIPELSNFHEKKTFDIWSECLRGAHLRDDQFLFLADTNPADEGEDSWIYRLWFILPKLEYPEYTTFCRENDLPILSESAFKSYKNSLGALTFNIADNPFLSKERVERLEATYHGDQDLYDRYILGLWKKASMDAIFRRVFRSKVHLVGDIATPGNPDPEIMVPEKWQRALYTGWDPGSGINSAYCVVEKVQGRIALPNGNMVTKSIFKVLDEFVITDNPHSLDEFTEECVRLMEWWETACGQPFEWEHWSDRSVFDMREPRKNKHYHQIVYEASGGLVALKAADRGPGSIKQRVDLLHKLLFENRILFSHDKCPRIIEMLRSMRKGNSLTEPIARGSRHKHPFDALMYCVASLAYDEIEETIFERVKTSWGTKSQDSLIAIPI
jgi:hypothetical protein